jgi:transcriptional regulator with XRE-family HTH domain
MNTKESQNPIRKLRRALGLTQEQFAARLSDYLTGGAVSLWESGRRIPGAYYLDRLEVLRRGEVGPPKGEIPPYGGLERRTPRYGKKRLARRSGRPRGSEDWSQRKRRPK